MGAPLEQEETDQTACDGPVQHQATIPQSKGFEPIAIGVDPLAELDQVPDTAADDPAQHQHDGQVRERVRVQTLASGPPS